GDIGRMPSTHPDQPRTIVRFGIRRLSPLFCEIAKRGERGCFTHRVRFCPEVAPGPFEGTPRSRGVSLRHVSGAKVELGDGGSTTVVGIVQPCDCCRQRLHCAARVAPSKLHCPKALPCFGGGERILVQNGK